MTMEIEKDTLALNFPEPMRFEEVPTRLKLLVELRNLIPNFVLNEGEEKEKVTKIQQKFPESPWGWKEFELSDLIGSGDRT